MGTSKTKEISFEINKSKFGCFFSVKALAQKGLPPNAKRAWKSLLDLANDAWITIGDTATDVNNKPSKIRFHI